MLPPDADPRKALEAWYRRQARAEVAPRLDAAVARAGRSYTTLQIRGQRTRWASCSTSGAMSFNWRLLLAPAEILDYVVEHEVAHLDVQDHSERFWRRCLALRAARHEAWLRRTSSAGCGRRYGMGHRACRTRSPFARRHSQRKNRTARKSATTRPGGHHERRRPHIAEPPPTIASERPSIRCFSGSASAITFSASGRSSAE